MIKSDLMRLSKLIANFGTPYCTMILFSIELISTCVCIFNCHLPHIGAVASYEKQLDVIVELKRIAETKSKRLGWPMVTLVQGDFNTELTTLQIDGECIGEAVGLQT